MTGLERFKWTLVGALVVWVFGGFVVALLLKLDFLELWLLDAAVFALAGLAYGIAWLVGSRRGS